MSARTRAAARLLALALLPALPAAAVAAVLTGGPEPAQASPAVEHHGARQAQSRDAAPLRLLSDHAVDARVHELRFSTPYLDAPTTVRVLLPTGYATAHRHYPVLLLLDGCCNAAPQARDWTNPKDGDAERLVGARQVIVVMPDTGFGGLYTDWYNNGAGGNPRWESYHITQLLPWVDQHYRTVAGRGGHAVAGLSMGGFGAMSYAARHPDLFVSAAAFSGIVDSNTRPGVGPGFDEALAALDGGAPGSAFGDRATQEVRWRAHNPWDLAANLRGLRLDLLTGNGDPGPFNLYPDPEEGQIVAPEMRSLHARLTQLHIAHGWRISAGSHSWPYWRRDLRTYLPHLMATFAHPPAPPRHVTFTAAEPTFGAYGFRVRMHRAVLEFATLRHAARHGFALTGSGTAVVTTAPLYRPGRRYRVTTHGLHVTGSTTLRATRRGRLVVPVTLGPGNPAQELTANATTHHYTTSVRIHRAHRTSTRTTTQE